MIGEILSKLGVTTKDTFKQTLPAKTQATANTAGESVEWDIPMDMFLFSIDLKCTQDTDGALADKISQVDLILDGSKTIRNISGNFLKAIAYLRGYKPSTGFYPISVVDEQLGTDPLYLPNYSSLKLKVTVAAAGSGVKAVITPTLQLGARSSYAKLVDTKTTKLLVETMGTTKAYSTNTGNQEYEHQRGQVIAGYLYQMADNGSASATIFSKYSLQLSSALQGHQKIAEEVDIATLKENNTEEARGNALPTGVFYVPIRDTLKTTDYTSIKAILYIPSAGTNAQLTVLERQIFG